MTIGPETRFAVLIGDPVEHSFSPLIHNTTYHIQGYDAVYLAARVGRRQLADAAAGLRGLGFMGANITTPHKERVLDFLDELTPEADAIGAVNAIVCRPDEEAGRIRLVGDNTDVTGFLAPLATHHHRIEGGSVVILGAGGAARAVLYGTLTSLKPSKVALVVRRAESGRNLVSTFSDHARGVDMTVVRFEDATMHVSDADLFVNTTPVGMYPNVDNSPWPDAGSFHSRQIVYDLVYNPVETRLMRDAASRGATVLNGVEMLLGQASVGHMLWTGLRMPVDQVREVLLKTIHK